MKLTPLEEKMISRLRKQNADAKKWRWVNLIAAGIFIAPLLYLSESLKYIASENFPVTAFVHCFYMILAMPWSVIGALLLVKAVWEWNGNPTTTLLLKLLDDKTGKDGKQDFSKTVENEGRSPFASFL